MGILMLIGVVLILLAGVMWLTDRFEGWVTGTIATIGLFLIMSFGGFWWSQVQCRNKAEALGFPYRWSIATKCLIQVDGQWVPLENYRFLDD